MDAQAALVGTGSGRDARYDPDLGYPFDLDVTLPSEIPYPQWLDFLLSLPVDDPSLRGCTRCGFKWTPRVASRPVACPNCCNRDWDKPPRSSKAQQAPADGSVRLGRVKVEAVLTPHQRKLKQARIRTVKLIEDVGIEFVRGVLVEVEQARLDAATNEAQRIAAQQKLLQSLGVRSDVIPPPPRKEVNAIPPPPGMLDRVEELVRRRDG